MDLRVGVPFAGADLCSIGPRVARASYDVVSSTPLAARCTVSVNVEPAPNARSTARSPRVPLVARWLDRIVARVTLTPERVFPTGTLLNHVPLLIDGIAAYLERPDRELDAEAPVIAKAMELSALRHARGSTPTTSSRSTRSWARS